MTHTEPLPPALAGLAKQLEFTEERLRTAVSEVQWERIAQRVAQLQDHARRIGEAGWTLPMWSTAAEISEILEQAAKRDIDDVLVAYYEAQGGANYSHLKSSLVAGNKLHPWRPLIQQCFTAFESDLCLVVVPAMITVIEGAIAKAGDADAWRRKDPKQTARKIKAQSGPRSVKRVIWISIDSFVSQLFESHAFTGKKPPGLNRQWILHGRDKPSWARPDCLRLFQAADTIGA